MTSETYDSDDAMNRSPPPVPQTIKYGVDAPPRPPFVPKSDDPENAKGTPDRSPPDRPDIAQHALQYPLMDESPKRDRTEEKEATDRDSRQLNEVPRLRPPKDHKRDGRQSISPLNKSMPPPGSVDTKHESVSPRQPPIRPSLGAPARRPSIEQPQWSPPFRSSTQTSPDAQPRVSLPSLGSPSSSCGPSPDTGSGSGSGSGSKQVLPSIHSALSALANDFPPPRPNGLPPPYPYPGSATSRNDSPHDRQLPQLLSHQIPPSPFSHFSPASTKDVSNNPSPATQPSLWQRTPIPPSSESHPPATPFDASPVTAKSPATSYPTPTEQVAPTAGSDHFSLSQASCNGATMGGNYKCTHPGCTAPPFQTQYLLNSHANVHSQERPHFCPVEGCPRGAGGKGFKRKNEMMRHGLVHNSPGYVCPFCPDQQHKYPRPDNLQRHVRVHHVDKDKDDPILRQVLAQRPSGSTRGRRRRLNSG